MTEFPSSMNFTHTSHGQLDTPTLQPSSPSNESVSSTTPPFKDDHEDDEGEEEEERPSLEEEVTSTGEPSPETTSSTNSTSNTTDKELILTPTQKEGTQTTFSPNDTLVSSMDNTFNNTMDPSLTTLKLPGQTINQSSLEPSPSFTPQLMTGVILTSSSPSTLIPSFDPSKPTKHADTAPTTLTPMTMNFPEEENGEEYDILLHDNNRPLLFTPPLEIPSKTTTTNSIKSTEEDSKNSTTTTLPDIGVTTTRDGKTIHSSMDSTPQTSLPNFPSSSSTKTNDKSVNNDNESSSTPTPTPTLKPIFNDEKDKNGKENPDENPTLFPEMQPTLASGDDMKNEKNNKTGMERPLLSPSFDGEVMLTLQPQDGLNDEDEETSSLQDTPVLTSTPTTPSLTSPTILTGDHVGEDESKVSILPTALQPSKNESSLKTLSTSACNCSCNVTCNCTQSVPSSPLVVPTAPLPPCFNGNQSKKNNSSLNNTFNTGSPTYHPNVTHPLLTFKTSSGQVIYLDWLPVALISIGFFLIFSSWVFGFIMCKKNRRLRRDLASSLTSDLISTKIQMPALTPSGHDNGTSEWKTVSTPALVHQPLDPHSVGTSSTSYTTSSSSTAGKEFIKNEKKRRKKDKSEFEYISFTRPSQSSSSSSSQQNLMIDSPKKSIVSCVSFPVNQSLSHLKVNRSIDPSLILPIPKERTSLQIHRFSSQELKGESKTSLNESGRDHQKNLEQENEQMESRRAVEDLSRFFEVQDQSNKEDSRAKKKPVNNILNPEQRVRRIQKTTLDVVKEKVVVVPLESAHNYLQRDDRHLSTCVTPQEKEETMSYIPGVQEQLLHQKDLRDSTKQVVHQVRQELNKFDSVIHDPDPDKEYNV